MEKNVLDKITNKVSKRFPEVVSSRPTIKERSGPNQKGVQYELTFKGKVNIPGGRTIHRIVRVVADPKGKIIRMSTSK